jgi:hypothetical protein
MAVRRPARRRLPPRRRPTAEARGYGRAHAQLRRQVAKAVAAGQAVCWRCGRWINPVEPWDLGHDDHRLAKHLGRYRGAEHRYCSRSAGAWKRHGYTMPPQTLPPSTSRALKFFDVDDVAGQENSETADE